MTTTMPNLLKRASSTGPSGNPSPVKVTRSMSIPISTPITIRVFTKSAVRGDRGNDKRGDRVCCLVQDTSTNGYYIAVAFGHAMISKIDIGNTYTISNYFHNNYTEACMTENSLVLQLTQINIQTSTVLELKNQDPITMPTQPISTVTSTKVYKCHFNICAKVTDDLGAVTVPGRTGKFQKQRYRIADATGNVIFSLLDNDRQLYNLEVGKTYNFGLCRAFFDSSLPEGCELNTCWYSSISPASQQLETVASEETKHRELLSEVESIEISFTHKCHKCFDLSVTFTNEGKMMKCGSCGVVGKASKAMAVTICKIEIMDDATSKEFAVNQTCISQLLGDDYEQIKNNSDPNTAAFERLIDKQFLFKLHPNPTKMEIVDIQQKQ